jgi:predicted dehydrogenase
MTTPLRFGLVGTGFWASSVHAQALSSADGIDLVGVWGRDHGAAQAVAARHGAIGFTDADEMFGAVDAVAFAVPPSVQCSMALRAAQAGKHVLLEKPIATSLPEADALVRAVDDAGVASVVFFTARYRPEMRTWLRDVSARGGWAGGSSIWLGSVLSSALSDSNPFNTPWRRQKGGLWDLGPHVVSLLWAALGPVVGVRADAGAGDLTHLVLHHAGGATSTATVTLSASEAAEGSTTFIWGEAGRSEAPAEATGSVQSLRVALGELAECARSGRVEHECDVRFGRDVVGVLAAAEDEIARRR